MDSTANLHKQILDELSEGVYFVDKDRKITYWNKGAEEISGFKAEDVMGKHCYANVLRHIDDNGAALCKGGCPLQKTLLDGQERNAGVYLHHREGHRVSVAVNTIPIYEQGAIIGAAEIFTDDNKRATLNKTLEKYKELALYDALTELPNRRYIDTFLENQLREFEELGISFVLIMMDIDHFKLFNDTYGHDVGDLVLKMVAKTFRDIFRKNDVVGRWGGEEFLAVLKETSLDELKEITDRTRLLIEKSELNHNGKNLNVTISIGATRVCKQDTALSIQKRADKALYKSKESGRNKVTIL
ncbi:MAG: GGDEF domain-containing protein [Clostridia bacterium]|nr:GGDEF domain-containing protein [Clostridia bacterium]